MMRKRGYVTLPALYVALSYSALFINRRTVFDRLVSELGYYENAGALGFLVAGALFVVAFVRSGQGEGQAWARRLTLAALGVVLLVGAGEEISWGQHYFDYATPEALADINRQEEMTLHNIHFRVPEGLAPVLGDEIIFSDYSSMLLNLLWMTFGVAIPFTAALWPAAKQWLVRVTAVLPWQMGLPFVLNYVVLQVGSAVFRSETTYLFSTDKRFGMNEIRESNVGVLLAVAALYVVRELTPPLEEDGKSDDS